MRRPATQILQHKAEAASRPKSDDRGRCKRDGPPALHLLEFSPEPITYDDMREGCYEPAARVADMDQGFVLSSLLFPSFPRYCGQVFHEAKDKDLALSCVQAWNDFILEELAGDHPGRFIPMMIIPLWDPTAAAKEIERTAALGAKSIAFSENPTKLGLPSIHTDFWDPVLSACNDTGYVLSMHVGSSSNLIRTSPDMPEPTIDRDGVAWRIYPFGALTLIDYFSEPIDADGQGRS